jgi:hypothetical protein
MSHFRNSTGLSEMISSYITESFLSEQIMNEAVDLLYEKLVVFGGGAKYGQIVFMAGGAGCFDKDTLVKTSEGYKKICEVKAGDLVYTLNEETKEIELKPVLRPISFDVEDQTEDLLEITFDNGQTIVCTENHLFYVDGQWIKAKHLESVYISRLGASDRKVYDLSIADNHNYMITENDIIVHNSGKGFASSTFMESEKFKIRDVDEWKKAYLKLSQIKDRNPELKGLDLRNSKDVFKLHMFVKERGIKDKTLDLLLKDARADRLPNIIFDITAKEMKDFEEVIPFLEEAGYQPRNIHLAWVLTDFRVAYTANLTRERVVPADVFLDTHRGASKTMQRLIDNKKMPKGADGRFVVILNNRENTVFFATGDTFKGRKVDLKNQKKVNAPGVKGFYYITVKEAGKPFKPESQWKEELHNQIVQNVPGGQDNIDTLRKNALEALTKDVDDPDKKEKSREAARQGIDLVRRDAAVDRAVRKMPRTAKRDQISRVVDRLTKKT